jgi:DUF4097 and DUF4098 domain-containing protein YvlB
VSTQSGRVTIGTAATVTAQTVSGRIEVGTTADGTVAARTVSGRVSVSVPPGSDPSLELQSHSGRVEVRER